MNTLSESRLDNGVQIITRHSPACHSAALGIWLVNGARHQQTGQSGYAHLLEHLVFRRTQRYTGKQLSELFESMGGNINAQTGRELTAYHGLVPGDAVYRLVDLFASMLLEPAFTEADIEIEREVVLQELAMLHDDPEEFLEDTGSEIVWGQHPMGWQILGDSKSLRSATAAHMHDYLASLLDPARILVVATGNVNHEKLCEACKPFSRLTASAQTHGITRPEFRKDRRHFPQDLEQNHLLWLMPGPSARNEELIPGIIANHMLAGGVSSRLYQQLREDLGLVYSIQSRIDPYSDTGLWLIQTSSDPEQAGRCREQSQQIISQLCREGPSDSELEQAREHISASLLIEEDDLEASMERIAREIMYLGRIQTLEEKLDLLAHTGRNEVQLAIETAWKQHAFFSIGPGDGIS